MGAEVPSSGRVKLVVTVKAYPSISEKHGEVVCVAGIRTDTPTPRWVRLFPIWFRDLPFSQRFKKYQEITVGVAAASDPRPETLRPLPDTLELGPPLSAKKDDWASRRRLVDPLMAESMCEIAHRQERDGTSLGVFRPAEVDKLLIEPDESDWKPGQQAQLVQPSLFAPDNKSTSLKKVPYRFRYHYRCRDRSCGGHTQMIVDWEIAQAFLGWTYLERERLRRIEDRWLGELCAPNRDTAFFVGNMHRHPKSFLVLGVFWPPSQAQLDLCLD